MLSLGWSGPELTWKMLRRLAIFYLCEKFGRKTSSKELDLERLRHAAYDDDDDQQRI